MVALRPTQVPIRDCWGDGEREIASSGEPATIPRVAQRPPSRAASCASARRNGCEPPGERLARTVEIEIVPRLVLARRPIPHPRATPALESTVIDGASRAEAVSELAERALAQDAAAALDYIERLRAHGVAADVLYLDLLAPTARYLGELWEADVCDFAQVTVGVCRLQHVLHELGNAWDEGLDPRAYGHRALLAPGPGEQHTFGLLMVAEYLRHAGFDVAIGPGAASAECLAVVAAEWFAIVGLSVGCDRHLEAVAPAVRAIRRASRNREIGVMVGGRAFVEHPERVGLSGADASARDARDAAVQAQRLLALLGTSG